MPDNLSSNTHRVHTGEGKWTVEAFVRMCGNDVQAVFTGGEAPHIGAVALATPRPGLNNPQKVSASASVLCVTGHKDDELARFAALQLAAGCNATVCVTVGIHVDDATAHDIKLLSGNFTEAVDRIMSLLTENKSSMVLTTLNERQG